MAFLTPQTHHSYPGNFILRNTTQTAVECQVFTACQKVIDGIKLGAVAHVLVNSLQVIQHTVGVEGEEQEKSVGQDK